MLLDWNRLSPLALLLAFLAITFPLWSNAYLSAPDSASYFAYPRSIVRNLDLDFANDYEKLSFRSYYVYLTQEDHVSNDWPIGAGLVYMPAYVAAEITARACAAAGLDGHVYTQEDRSAETFLPAPLTAGWDDPLFAPTGQSGIYKLIVTLYIALITVFVLRLGISMAEPFATRGTALAGAFVLVLGTPVGFYLYAHAMMAHLVSMAAVGLLLWLWSKTRDTRTYRDWALLGMLAGIAAMIRPQNAAFLIIFPIEFLLQDFRNSRVWKERLAGTAVAFGAAIVAFSPQFIAWGFLYGNPFQLPKIEEMHWFQPAILSVLVSEYHGLFSWSPVLILAIPGFYYLYKKDRILSLGLVGAVCVQWYINAANEVWWASGSFGARRFINCGIPFLIALACVFQRMRPMLAWVVAGPLVLWNMLLFAAERGGHISLERYVPWDGAFVQTVFSMLNPMKSLPDLMGDFAGFGWVMRILVFLLLVALAALIQFKGKLLPKGKLITIASWTGVVYILLLPVIVFVAASRTSTRTENDFPFPVARYNQSLFLSFQEYGYFNLQKERWDAAREAYQRAADLLPSAAQPWRYLGTLALRQDGDPEQALEYTGRALDINPAYDAALEIELEAIQELYRQDSSRKELLRRAVMRLRAAGREEKASEVERLLQE